MSIFSRRRTPLAVRALPRRLQAETLEERRLLATLGIDIRFLTDNGGLPGIELQSPILRGEPFWVDVRVQDVRVGQPSQGIIALPLNLAWDEALFQFVGDANLTSSGNSNLPLTDRLVTNQFPIQRAVSSYSPAAGPFDPTTLLSSFNLRGVRGAALPNAGAGQAIGVGMTDTFSLLRFVAIADSTPSPFTVNLDGSMSFADADVLDGVVGLANTTTVTALANTVQASIAIVGGSISGQKFDDTNGDGVRDTGEPGFEGVTIRLTPADTQQVPQTRITDINGTYSFDDLAAGTYSISEMLPENSVITRPTDNLFNILIEQDTQNVSGIDFGNFRYATFNGVKFNDLNNNGVRDAGEPGLAGVTIRLNIGNDSDPSNDPAPQVTDVNGTYRFEQIGPGTHAINEDVPIGFQQTAPASGQYIVSPVSGQIVNDLDFGNFQIPPLPILTTISGKKFNDLDGNGQDNGDPGRGGVTIQLDLDNNGSIDRETMTAADGTFQFTQVPTGTHAINEIVPSGTVATTPTSIVVPVVQIPITGLLFGNFELNSFSGVSFNDLNQDGIQDSNEPALPGVVIQLDIDNNGSTDQTVLTGSDGRYQFTGIGPNTHAVRELVPSGFAPTAPNPPLYVFSNGSGSSRNDLNFGNRVVTPATSSILGLVYSDVDRNGQFDSGEAGLPGVTVQLFSGGSATAAQTAITGADGSYRFAGLAAGTYRIVEVQPTGFLEASITLGTILPGGEVRGTTTGFNTFDNLVIGNQETAIDYNFGDVLAVATKRFFVANTFVNAELCSNLGSRCTPIRGTSGDDDIRIERLSDGRLFVTINNTPITLIEPDAQYVMLDALGGQDSVTFIGNAETESIRVTASQLAVTTLNQSIGVFNAEQIRVEGGGGNDTAELRDTSDPSQLTASGNSVVLTTTNNRRIEVVDIDNVQAISAVDDDDDRANIQAIDFVLNLIGDWRRSESII